MGAAKRQRQELPPTLPPSLTFYLVLNNTIQILVVSFCGSSVITNNFLFSLKIGDEE